MVYPTIPLRPAAAAPGCAALAQASATSMPLMAKCLRKKSTMRTALSWNCCGVSTAENTGTSVRNCDVHQRLDHGVGDEFMAVDAAIDHEPCRDDRGVAPRLGENLRMQRDFERARHLEHDRYGVDMPRLRSSREEGDAALVDHVAMPGRLHRRRRAAVLQSADATAPADAPGVSRLVFGRCLAFGCLRLRTSDSWLSSSGPESGHTERRIAHAKHA